MNGSINDGPLNSSAINGDAPAVVLWPAELHRTVLLSVELDRSLASAPVVRTLAWHEVIRTLSSDE